VPAPRLLLAAALVLVALPVGYIGLFLIGYSGDSATPADVYVDLAGRRIDADLVGIAAVGAALLLVAAAFVLARRVRGAARPPR
jgi:hypothetical protein